MTPGARSAHRPWAAAGALAALLLSALPGLARAGSPPSLSPAVLAALGAQASGGNTFPPPGEVFHFKAAPGAHRLRLSWTIRPGFYLYRSRIHVRALSGTALGALSLPPGIVKIDPFFGREQIYRTAVTGELAVQRGTVAAPGDAALAVTYQGCADAGLCYPPITQTVTVALPAGLAAAVAPAAPAAPPSGAAAHRSASPRAPPPRRGRPAARP